MIVLIVRNSFLSLKISISEKSRRRNVLSPKRPVAELAVAEMSHRRTGCRRNGGRQNWRLRMGVAEMASPKRPNQENSLGEITQVPPNQIDIDLRF